MFLALAINFFSLVLLTDQRREVYIAAIIAIIANLALALFAMGGALVVNHYQNQERK
jgi:hypothetical protein